MRVLDLGCGAGDVCLLAASVVGPSGSVVGVDRSAEAIETARRRAAAMGVTNVEYQMASIEAFLDSEPFDAMIGRFVLMYSADPAMVLERLLPLMKPSGIVAFLEMDMVAARTVPAVAFVGTVVDWLGETFRRGGVPLDLASQVWRIFRAAGLTDSALIVRSNGACAGALGHRLCGRDGEKPATDDGTSGRRDGSRGGDRHARRPPPKRARRASAAMLSPLVVGTWSRVRM